MRASAVTTHRGIVTFWTWAALCLSIARRRVYLNISQSCISSVELKCFLWMTFNILGVPRSSLPTEDTNVPSIYSHFLRSFKGEIHSSLYTHKHWTHRELFAFFFYQKNVEYFISTSTNLPVYTVTEARESHFNFRGTKTGNFNYFRLLISENVQSGFHH